MATSTPVKTDSVVLLSHRAVTHPTTEVGAWFDWSTKKGIQIVCYHAYIEAAADTNPGKFLIQIRPDNGSGSVSENAITIREFVVKGTTPDEETLSGSESAGSTVLEVASTTGFAVGDELYIQDVNVVADGEWATLKKLTTNTSIELFDGLANAKDSADKIFNDASKFSVYLDLAGVESGRVLWHHEGATGANGHIMVLGITYDSDSIV